MKPILKRLPCVLVLGLAAATSCGPASYVMEVETRSASVSGLDLHNKTISVSFTDGGDDLGIGASLAEGFAEALEKDYYGGEHAIDIYSIKTTDGQAYASKDSLVRMVMDTGTDVVFLLQTGEIGLFECGEPSPTGIHAADSAYSVRGSMPYRVKVHVYDSLNPSDTVIFMTGTTSAVSIAYTSGKDDKATLSEKLVSGIGPSVMAAGTSCARYFISGWESSDYRFYHFEGQGWDKALEAAYEYRWQDAVKEWMSLLDTRNLEKRACLEYNIAAACLILGQKDLAAEWLDRSDRDSKRASSDWLRKKLSR